MKKGDGLQGPLQLVPATAMISQDAPILEARDGMFDACTSRAMPTPRSIAHDASTMEHRCDELGHTSITAIGEHATMLLAQSLDLCASIVERIVAVPWAASDDGNDVQVRATDKDLCVARIPVVLGFGCVSMVACWHERPVDDP